jgi:FkbM family methyltransferase
MNLLSKIKRRILPYSEKPFKVSYSQCGEDLIVDFAFRELKPGKITYLDIGAHHATYLNNTAFFYKKGDTGVCIEPDPILFKKFKRSRPKDICLNVGIGDGKITEADFYIMSGKTLNTFSKEEAERYVSYGTQKIEQVVKMPLVSVNDIIKTHFDKAPDFISLDVEGYDFAILKSFDFAKYRPKVWCIETLTYTENKTETKIKETVDYLLSKNYFIYGDTYINTIFVDKEAWENRK